MGAPAGSITVLHVEDEADFAELTAAHLQREDEGLAVTTATTVDEGLERFREEPVDCIVSDYDIPPRDGIDFLESVRELDPDIPFMLLTGKGSEEVASEAISAGVTDYLQKGTGTGQYAVLANRIRNAVEGSRAERAAARTERRLTELARNSNDILWMFSADWSELLFMNDAYETIWGESAEELRAEPTAFLDGVHPDDRERVRAAMEALSEGRSIDIEFRVNASESYGRWVWVQGEPIREDGGVARGAGFARDVTARKRREQALEELHAVATELPSYDTEEAVCRRIVAAAENILEFDMCVTNLESDGWLDVVATSEELPEGGAAGMAVDEGMAGKTYQTGESYRIDDVAEATAANPQGPYRSALSIPIGEHGVFQTVSESTGAFDDNDRELAELLVAHAIRELDRIAYERSLEQYETIVEASGDGIYVADAEGQYTLVNEAFADLTGYDQAELVGTHASSVLSDDSYEQALDNIRMFLSGETDTTQTTQEVTVVRADGERVPCEDGLALLPLEGGEYRGVAGVVRDISARKARERELEQYETMTNAIGDMVYILDNDGHFQFVNDAAEDLTGYSRDELLDAHVTLLADRDDVKTSTAVLEELHEGNKRATAAFTWTLTAADGTELPVESQISLLYDGDEVVGSVGVVRDVADQLERERELERRNERLEAFTSVVSHDLRNPLNVAAGRLELAREDCESPHLGEVAHALDRMDALIDDLLTLARNGQQVGETEPVGLAAATERAWRTVAGEDATLSVETDQRVLADPGRLDGLLENLLHNCAEHGHSDGGARIVVGDLPDGFYSPTTDPEYRPTSASGCSSEATPPATRGRDSGWPSLKRSPRLIAGRSQLRRASLAGHASR